MSQRKAQSTSTLEWVLAVDNLKSHLWSHYTMATFSFVVMTWNRPASWLRNSIYTLSHQTIPPLEIIVVDASPDNASHEETHKLCANFPLVTVIDAYWPKFNISRGFNVGIKASAPKVGFVVTTCMEIYFPPNLVEELNEKAAAGRFNGVACGSLKEEVGWPTPEAVWEKWAWYLTQIDPPVAHITPGALVCAPRDWWLQVQGYDEAKRPYCYPDVDIIDRARRSGLQMYNVWGRDATVLHPYHGLSSLFYSVGGLPVNTVADADVVRNRSGWGQI